jgi:predicted transcriptional regulator
MSEQTVSFSVDSGLLNAFVLIAEKNSCDDTELLKAFMAEYVQQDLRQQQYEAWFRAKVEKGLSEIQEGLSLSSEQAEAQMAAFKASIKDDFKGQAL